jgi:plasmid maintenance system antidote protein VapI
MSPEIEKQPIHPGPAFAAKIKAAGFKQLNIAAQLGVAPSQFSEILSGKRAFSAEMCAKAQQIFGYGRELWQQQADYEYHAAAVRISLAPPLQAQL